MVFTMVKDQDEYIVKEKERTIFKVTFRNEGKLLEATLHNAYGDDVISAFQIKRWYSGIRPQICNDLNLYEGDEKLGELHKKREYIEIKYHDVFYRLYSGMHAGKRTLICFDRSKQIAEFVLEDTCTLRFTNGTLGALFSLVMAFIKEALPQDKFSQEAFLHHYIGVYRDESLVAA